jgi:hypothetical protein
MLVQKELKNPVLARILKNIDEKELLSALEPFLKNQPQLLKVGKHKPFKPFKAIKMEGEGINASEMVVRDRM